MRYPVCGKKKVQSLIAFLSVKYLKLGASLQLLEPSANVHRYQTSFVNKESSKMTSYNSLAFIKSVLVPFIFCIQLELITTEGKKTP